MSDGARNMKQFIEQLREAASEMRIDGHHAWANLCLGAAELLDTGEGGASDTAPNIIRSDRTETDGASPGANIDQGHECDAYCIHSRRPNGSYW